ncbi:MAG: NrfD/PsrC family molybdoenzyme membrane anchor subunit [bacterium]
MVNDFSVAYRTTEAELGPMIALGMSAEGAGAALFVISVMLGAKTSALLGLGTVCLGAGALFAHLGHPSRFWRVVSKSRTTWISRGAVFTGGLIGCGALSLIMPDANGWRMLSHVFSFICAVVVMLYTGFHFSSMNAVPFWHSPLLPTLLLVQSTATAGVAAMIVIPTSGSRLVAYPQAVSAVIATLLLCLGLTWVYLKSSPPCEAARESVRLLTEGRLRSIFVMRGAVLGLVGPTILILSAVHLSGTMAPPVARLLSLALILRVLGDFSFRHAILRSGVYAPVV